ncbi:MAG: TRAP transporter fused permease subunit [Candidatus Nezhaarchaeales archaeon]
MSNHKPGGIFNLNQILLGQDFNLRRASLYVTGLVWTTFQLYATYVGFELTRLMIIHITFALIYTFIYKHLKIPVGRVVDVVLIALVIVTGAYFLQIADLINARIPYITPLSNQDLVFGTLLILLVIEGVRRVAGLPLTIFISVIAVYGFLGRYIPEVGHRVSPQLVFEQIAIGTAGIYGTLLFISATYVFLLVVFSSLFSRTGVGDFYMKLALVGVGRAKGGGAKATVVANVLFGTITGASVTAVLATGVFTIPLMMQLGYRASFAGGITALAGTGAQIMPPIMGTAAFLIAQALGVSYWDVCVAAIIPALLYFTAIYIYIDLIAKKEGLMGVTQRLTWRETVKDAYLLVPLAVLVYRLATTLSVISAVLDSIIACFIIAVIKITLVDRKPKDLMKILNGLAEAPKEAITVANVLAGVGVVVGILSITGLGSKLVILISSLSMGFLWLTVALTMLVCLLLGMGMPTTAAYVLTSSIAAPIFIFAGFDRMATHLFIFFYACLSAITPPVAVSSYAGASLSKASIGAVSLEALKASAPLYIIPWYFLTYNDILHPNSIFGLMHIAQALVGIVTISIGTAGYLRRKLSLVERATFLSVSILMLIPNTVLNLIGVLIFVSLLVKEFLLKRESRRIT